MAAKEIKKATKNLTCPVCIEVFKNPKYLPCYHSYCQSCLEKLQKQSKITCPECRKEAVVPAGGVKNLANNFFINRLVDEFILKRKVEGEEEVKCDICDEEDPVVSYCSDCSAFLCYVCNESHKRDRRSRGHGIVPLTELRSNKDAELQVKKTVPLCKEHDEQLKYYCETCEELVCMYCTVKEHNGHNHDTVKKMVGKHLNEMREVTAPLKRMSKGLNKAYSNVDNMRKRIMPRRDELDWQIDRHYDKLVEMLMNQKQQMKQRLNDTISQKDKEVAMQLEELQNAQAEVLSLKELKDAIEKSSDHEIVSVKKQVVIRMRQLSDKYSKMNTQPIHSDVMEFVPLDQPLPQFSDLRFGQANKVADYDGLTVWLASPYALPESYATRNQKLPHEQMSGQFDAGYMSASLPTTGIVNVEPKCPKCKEFYANEEYGGLCSGCFNEMTIKESKLKPPSFHLGLEQQVQEPCSIFSALQQAQHIPPSQAKVPMPSSGHGAARRSPLNDQLYFSTRHDASPVQKKCASFNCHNPVGFLCQGYCRRCFERTTGLT